MNPVYFINYDGYLASVYESQILGYISQLRQQQIPATLVNFVSNDELASPLLQQRRWLSQQRLGQHLIELKKHKFSAINKFKAEAHTLNKVLKSPSILHARGYYAAAIANRIAANAQHQVVFDARGIAPEEFSEYQGNASQLIYHIPGSKWYKQRLLESIEKNNLTHSQALLCVSHNMLKHYQAKHSALPAYCNIIPTCINPEYFNFNAQKRQQLRKKLNIEDRLVLIYSGSLSNWHCAPELFQLFQQLNRRIANLFIILLTPQINVAHDLIIKTQLSKEKVRCDFIGHEALPEYLNAADIGILLRHDHIINSVAAPTKASEYLSCGLPLIHTSNIGSLADITLNPLSTFPVNVASSTMLSTDLAQWVSSVQNIDRSGLSKQAQHYFSWHAHIEKLRSLYENLTAI